MPRIGNFGKRVRTYGLMTFLAAVIIFGIVSLHWFGFNVEHIKNGIDLSANWKVCIPTEGTYDTTQCESNSVSLPDNLKSEYKSKIKDRVEYTNQFITPSQCKDKQLHGCVFYLGGVFQEVEVLINHQSLGQHYTRADLYPASFPLPKALLHSDSKPNLIQLRIKTFPPADRPAVTQGPVGILNLEESYATTRSIIGERSILPVVGAAIQITLALIALFWLLSKNSSRQVLSSYILCCVAMALHQLYATRIPREYLDYHMGVIGNFFLHALSNTSIYLLILTYFSVQSRILNKYRYLYYGIIMSYFLIGLLYQFSPSFQMWYIHPPFTISGLPAFRRETFLFPFLAINLCMVVIEKLIGLSEAHRSFSKLPGSPVLFFLFLVITPLQCADILTFLGTIHTNHEIYYVRLFTPFISLAFGYAIWEGWIERERIAEATHRVGTIAQGVAHDLRSPLAVLKNFTHKPYNSDQAHFTLLNLAIERIEGIATNLLDTYKSTDSIVPSSVSQIIQELISTKTIPDRVQIQFTPPANEILCKIGKIELIRALDNLINNAIDATENVLEPRIFIRLTHLGNTAILEVVDNGNGPDEITLRNLNRHNFGTTTKPNGHGIGLSEVWRIVQIHGGTLSFSRNQGGGMCVKMGVKIV